jgi:hypothetical protein
MMSHANKGNLYAEDWAGTPAQNFTVSGMSAGIAALAASLGPESVPANSSKGLTKAAVIGIAVGSSVLGLLILLASYLWRRRRVGDKRTGVEAFISRNGESSSAQEQMYEPTSVSLCDPTHRTTIHDPVQRPFSQLAGDQTHILPITSEKTALFWRNELPASFVNPTIDPIGSSRSIRGPDSSLQHSASTGPTATPLLRPKEPASISNSDVSHIPPSATMPSSAVSSDVRLLLQRAESLRSAPGSVPRAQAVELQRRLEELGPIPEVLEALQAILRRQNVGDTELPRYEDGHV